MKIFTYRIVLEPDSGGFHGFVPLLKGVHTFGNTIEEAKKNLREAIQCHLEGLLKDKIQPPKQDGIIEATETFTVHA